MLSFSFKIQHTTEHFLHKYTFELYGKFTHIGTHGKSSHNNTNNMLFCYVLVTLFFSILCIKLYGHTWYVLYWSPKTDFPQNKQKQRP